MTAPVSLPPERPTTRDHRAAQIPANWRHAPGRGAIATCRTVRAATHGRARNEHVSFTLSVARNVVMNGHVIIPRGAKGVGHVSYRTKKGGFGKSGKMEVELDYIEMGDQRIPITGNQRVEGEGNSTATIATAAFLSIIGAGLITGRSAEIPRGREMTAWTKEDVPVVFPESALAGPQTPLALEGGIAAAPTAATRAAAQAAQRPRPVVNTSVRCLTCRQ